jgi:hypothetical protein
VSPFYKPVANCNFSYFQLILGYIVHLQGCSFEIKKIESVDMGLVFIHIGWEGGDGGFAQGADCPLPFPRRREGR